MKKIKIAMVGCGSFTNFHLENLLKIEDVEVVAFASGNKEKLKSTGAKVPTARLYPNHKEMYEKEEHIDAVFVCITPSGHTDVEILAAQKGIHLYVEKPIEVSLDRAKLIENVIKESGVISCVGYQERYNPEVEILKNYLEGKEVGLAIGKWLGGMPGVHWWREKEMSGGQMVEQSTHIFDILRFLFGEVHSVFSSGVTGIINDVPNYNIEDGSSTTLNFKSGLVATVLTACYIKERLDFTGIGFQVICQDEVIDYVWNTELKHTTKDGIETVDFTKDFHKRAVNNFIDAIRTNNPLLIKSDYSDGLKTLQVTLAANESISSKQPVILN